MYAKTNTRESIEHIIREKIKRLRHDHDSFRCNRPEIKVACILDEFSYSCFKYECSLMQLHAQTWYTQLEMMKPTFLLVESAWRGLDDSWKNHLSNIQKKPESPIWTLIEFCRQEKIPTVFWNKEDSPHYASFIATARLFDWVFTTDKNCVIKYKRDLGHNRIHVLPFAAQPVIHNPVNSKYQLKENTAFAGTWYKTKYTERQMDMAMILYYARQYNLHIFDRNYLTDNNRLRFPKEYQPYIIGSLPYNQMTEAYKLYKVFLNVNSVRNSPTMFSRRVFEILASGTNVISTYSQGIKKMFNGIVPITQSKNETNAYLSKLLTDAPYSRRLSLLGVREVNEKHLYEYRFNVILNKLGYPVTPKKGVSVIAYIDRIELIEPLRINFENQLWGKKELILFTKEELGLDAAVSKWDEAEIVRIASFPKETYLTDCIQQAINQSKYDFISFFHEDDFYGHHFLTDLMHAFHYTDAHIVGKCAHYKYFEWKKLLVLRSPQEEYKYVEQLQGSSMVIKKELFSQVQLLECSEDGYSIFFEDCIEKGMKMFATDPYNYTKRLLAAGDGCCSKDNSIVDSEEIIACGDDYTKHVIV